jgi:antitoxin (DNA-binding transcriptional repressor) of toxin-antitoxin stability system
MSERREKRRELNAGLQKLIREVEDRERMNFMLTATGKIVNDLVALANRQTKRITDLEAQVAALQPTPEDIAAEKAASDLLAAQPPVPPTTP